jgi:hypothetical protein
MTAALARWEEFRLHVSAGMVRELEPCDLKLEPCDLKEVLPQDPAWFGFAYLGFLQEQHNHRSQRI